MGVQIFVDSEAVVSLPTSSQSVTLQGLAGSFLFHKFLTVAMQLGDSRLAVSSLITMLLKFLR